MKGFELPESKIVNDFSQLFEKQQEEDVDSNREETEETGRVHYVLGSLQSARVEEKCGLVEENCGLAEK